MAPEPDDDGLSLENVESAFLQDVTDFLAAFDLGIAAASRFSCESRDAADALASIVRAAEDMADEVDAAIGKASTQPA